MPTKCIMYPFHVRYQVLHKITAKLLYFVFDFEFDFDFVFDEFQKISKQKLKQLIFCYNNFIKARGMNTLHDIFFLLF